MTDQQLTEAEIASALHIAGQLIDAGVPVFAAAPCPADCPVPGHGPGNEFHLPPKWQQTYPSRVWLGRWQPGWGLGAVGGSVADFIDVDVQHDGFVSLAALRTAGDMPRTFGVASTPSGGRHYVISPLAESRDAGVLPGVDYQGGAPDGTGRAFVWIAPTVKRSKNPETLGQLRPYRWTDEPDVELLADFAGSDDSGHGFVTRIHAHRASRGSGRSAAPAATVGEVDHLFASPSTAIAARDGGRRMFTRGQMESFLRPELLRLREAEIGEIEECANRAAVALAHFVPAFWDADTAFALLTDALSYTAYDPNGPSSWTADKFRPVLDGRRTPLDGWKAEVRPEMATGAADVSAFVSDGAPGPSDDAVAALLAEMRSPDDMATATPPPYLLHTLLTMDSEAWIIGAPGSKKSFVALDIAASVVTGRTWQGMKTRRGKVVVIVAEGSGGLGLRLRAWQKRYGDIGKDMFVLPRPVQAKDEAAWAVLVEACRRIEPVLVIMDTQARVTVGLDENSAQEMGVYIHAVGAMRQATGACVLTVHHTGRNGADARGSSAIDGAQGTELKIVTEGLRTILKTEKQKDLAEKPDVELRFEVVDLGVDEEGDPLSSLVLMPPGDAFDAASGTAERTGVYVPTFGEKDVWRQRIIDTLYLYAPPGGWLLSDLTNRLQEDFGAGQRKLIKRSAPFNGAWKDVLELTDPTGEPVVKQAGQRFEIGSLSVRAGLEARFPGGDRETDIL